EVGAVGLFIAEAEEGVAAEDLDRAFSLEPVGDVPQDLAAHPLDVLAVAVLDARFRLVDPAAAVLDAAGDADRKLVLDDRGVDHGVDLLAPFALLDQIAFGFHAAFEPGRIGAAGDVADGARQRALTVEGALRALQHFDPLKVEGTEVQLVEAVEAEGRVVHVDADE